VAHTSSRSRRPLKERRTWSPTSRRTLRADDFSSQRWNPSTRSSIDGGPPRPAGPRWSPLPRPGGALRGAVLPDEALPGAALPDGAPVGAAVPDEALPGAALPDGALPGATLPGGAPPGGALPGGALPGAAPTDGALSGAAFAEERRSG